ncbi:MAG: hypothetical protein RUDDFDWM_001355 [Candidatus Fervidibacterota bacterium]
MGKLGKCVFAHPALRLVKFKRWCREVAMTNIVGEFERYFTVSISFSTDSVARKFSSNA